MADEVKVVLQGDDQVTPVIEKIKSGISDLVSATGEAIGGVGELAAGFAVGELAADALKQAMQEVKEVITGMFEAAQAGQVANNDLANSFRIVGASVSQYSAEIEHAKAPILELGQYTDAQLNEALSRLVLLTGNVSTAIENLGLVTQVAAFKHIDLQSAALQVSAALDGEFTKIQRGIPGLKEAGDKMGFLREKMSGLDEAAANTMGGQLDRLVNRWKDFGDELLRVTGIATLAQNVLHGLGNIMGSVDDALKPSSDATVEPSPLKLGAVTTGGRGGSKEQVEIALLELKKQNLETQLKENRTALEYLEIRKQIFDIDDQIYKIRNPKIPKAPDLAEIDRKLTDAFAKDAENAARQAIEAANKSAEDARQLAALQKRMSDDAFKVQMGKDQRGVAGGGDGRKAALIELEAEYKKYQAVLDDVTSSEDAQAQATTRLQQIQKAGGAPLKSLIDGEEQLANTMNRLGDDIKGKALDAFESLLEAHRHLGQAALHAAGSLLEGVGKELLFTGVSTMLKGFGKIADSAWPPNPLEASSGQAMVTAGGAMIAAGGLAFGGGVALSGAGGGSSGGGGGGSGTGYNSTNGISGTRGNVTIMFPSTKTVFDPHDPNQRAAFQQFCNTLTGANVPVNLPGVGSQ